LERIKEERKTKLGTKYKELPPVDTSELPEIPVEWAWEYLIYFGALARGKSKHRPRNDKRLFGGDYPFIQTGEVRAANKNITTYTHTYSEFGFQQSKLWDEGTLCITIAANIAEVAFLGFAACFPDSIVGFHADTNIYADFIYYFFKFSKDQITSFAPATAQKNINLTILENLVVPYCLVVEQQQIIQEIEKHFSIADQAEATITASLKKTESLRQSILKRAFEGKLVHQDPNDEPATVLLERIKAEKEKLMTEQQANKKKKQ